MRSPSDSPTAPAASASCSASSPMSPPISDSNALAVSPGRLRIRPLEYRIFSLSLLSRMPAAASCSSRDASRSSRRNSAEVESISRSRSATSASISSFCAMRRRNASIRSSSPSPVSSRTSEVISRCSSASRFARRNWSSISRSRRPRCSPSSRS